MSEETEELQSILKVVSDEEAASELPHFVGRKEPTAPSLEVIQGENMHMPAYTIGEVKNTPTMFESIPEQNVIYCIDTSGSMYNALDAVKEHLVESLMQRAYRGEETLFNLVEFSTELTQWADQMVRCTPETVTVAAGWVQKLEAKTGTNTMAALMTAFSSDSCDAVCLVTDGHPDQHPTDILDNIASISQNRPVHCIYIHSGEAERSATDFLRDLAMETYGSFHVIAVTLHGCIEKITAVYRAEATAERIIRTTDGSIYPSNHKICSVTTSLNGPLPDVTYDPYYLNLPPPSHPYYFYPYPSRHYYQLHYPNVGWSRYRASRAGLRQPVPVVDSNIPGPGATLIGRRVLARRNADGYFYLATVKSQILDNKFLVEFGPCKHGQFKKTTYQEIFVYDLIAHDDALRHSVCVSDQVIAPFEPEGERYGPGVVIQGQEKRAAQGGPDEDIVVSFHNGKSCNVSRESACWIPRELHERITFELRLPKQVRCEFATQDKPYPEENMPGYPVSGPKATPIDYQVHESGWLERQEVAPMRQSYNPFYVPVYPTHYHHRVEIPARPDKFRAEDMDSVIPGTDITKAELNEKVMSQLMRHKMIAEDQKLQKDTDNNKLLHRREQQDENLLIKSLEKSVTFKDPESDLEGEVGDLELRDSGRGSSHDLELSDLEQTDEGFSGPETREVAVGTDRSLLFRPKLRRPQKRPGWKYWNSDPAPELLEPMHEGPYRVGPYDEAITMGPPEDRSMYRSGRLEWPMTMYNFADHMAKGKPDAYGVRESLHMPKPPDYKPEKQLPGRGVSEVLHGNLSEADQLAQYRVDYRRQKTFERENEHHERYENEDRMASMMQDQHHKKIQAQLGRDHQRHVDELTRVQNLREAKKQLNAEVRSRVENNQEREHERTEQRIDALRARRQRLDDIRVQREREIEQIKSQRQAAKQEISQQRWDKASKALDQQDAQQATQLDRACSAKMHRNQMFRRREADAQKHKEYLAEANDHRSSIFRSRIFP